MIRPDAARGLKRWSETLVAAGVVALGVWWALTTFGIVKWMGAMVAVAGILLLVLAVRRALFWRGSDGVGHVEVDEGAINYFAPEGGGAVPVAALSALMLVQTAGATCWRLSAPGAAPLNIPVDASGAETLFDVFANLPGIDMQALLRALNAAQTKDVVIWRRNDVRLH